MMTKRKRAQSKANRGEQGLPAGPRAPDEPPIASRPLVGSEVLDVIGSGGVPKREMHDVIHSPDDAIAEHHLGPLQEASVSFRPDPEVGDAGADFAEEFGQNFLRSATTGEDMSELENPTEMAPTEIGGPFLIESHRPSPKVKQAKRRRRHRPHA
jgi:hypothetical protein